MKIECDRSIDTIRCSALPEAFLCPGAVRTDGIRIDPVNEAADLGNAAHALMAQVVDGDLLSTAGLDIDGVARKYGVDRDELGVMVWRGVGMWGDLREAFAGARSERSMVAELEAIGVALTGHTDVLALFPEHRLARVLDWKGGRLDRDYEDQVFGYGAIVLLTEPDIDQVDLVIGWLREGEIERWILTRDALGPWLERLRQEVIAWNGTYHPGTHCAHCPRSTGCPALIAMEKRDLAIFGDPAIAATLAEGIASMDPAAVVDLWRKSRTLAKFAESFHELVKLRAGNLPLDSGDGKILKVVTEDRREIDTLKARPILEARLTPEEIAACTKVRAGEVDDVVAKKAGRGNGAAAKRALAKEMAEAGAVSVRQIRKLREVRK